MSQRRPVIQVVAHLKQNADGPAAPASLAIQTILDWLKVKQRLNLPAAAYRGESFEIDAAEGQPVSAVSSDRFWSVQFDRFDGDVPGRIWRTEASVGHSENDALAGVRLAVIDSYEAIDFPSTVPRVIGDLIRRPGLHDYGEDLLDSPLLLKSDADFIRLLSLLQSKRRTRPVVIFSSWSQSDVVEDAKGAAKRLAGLAHVYILTDLQSRTLTEQVGREFSVWNGAIRTYYPGFNPLTDESTQHPPATREWLSRRFGSLDRFYSVLVSSYAARSVRDSGFEQALPSFRAVKQAILQKQISVISSASQKKTEREKLLEENNKLLMQQVLEKSEEFDFADAEVKQAELERDQYRSQVSALRAINESLETRLGQAAYDVDYPDNFESLSDWALKYFAGRIVVLNRACRVARKSPFGEPQLVFKCLERLARDYVDARRTGVTIENLFSDLGVHLERTGDPGTLAQWRDQYFVPHRGRNYFLEWHLKRGSDKNEMNTMRIYFFYDEDDQQVIVGHLPSHLANTRT